MLPSSARQRLASLSLPGTVWIGTKPQESIPRFDTGVAPLNALLGGGVPRGDVSEIFGRPSSGRTALGGALLAAATRRGETTAVVDLPDAWHPDSLATAGADLTRVLWVQPPTLRAGLRCAELILDTGGFSLVVLDLGGVSRRLCHPQVWTRLARSARAARAVLVVLSQECLTDGVAALRLDLGRRETHWSKPPWRRLEGMAVQASVQRNRGGGIPGSVDLCCHVPCGSVSA